MKTYTINTVKVMGDKDEKFGYAYWGYVHEADMPVKFSTHAVIDDIKDKGRSLTADTVEVRETKKGAEYLLLKGVKLVGDKSDDTHTEIKSSSDNKYLKDVTDMPDRWMGRLLPYFDQQKLVKDGKITEHGRLYIETAMALAEESMRYIDKVRTSGSAEVPTPSQIKEATPAAEPLKHTVITANDGYEPYDG